MPAITDSMRRMAILRSEILALTDSLDLAAAAAPSVEGELLLEEAANDLMQAALSLQAAENSTRRSLSQGPPTARSARARREPFATGLT